MAQHDYSIANQSGAAFRSDLNNALAAIVSQNSGATAPSTTYAYQFWADTTNGLLKLRNAANSAWITLFQLDGEWSTLAVENGTAAAPSIYFKDSGTDTGFYSPGTDQVAISTGGSERVRFDANIELKTAGGTIYNATSDLYIRGGTSSMLRLGSNNQNDKMVIDSSGRVLVGTSSAFDSTTEAKIQVAAGNGAYLSLGIDDTTVTTAENLGLIRFYSRGGNVWEEGARIEAEADLDHASGDKPTRLVFSTTADGASTPTERVRIDSSGRLLVGTNSNSQESTLVLQGSSAGANDRPMLRMSINSTPSATNSTLAQLNVQNSAGSDGATISFKSDGAWTNGSSHPTRIEFATCPSGSAATTERCRITNNGAFDTYCQGSAGFRFNSSAGAGTTDALYQGYYSATGVTTGTRSFVVWSNGNVQNTNNSYTAISDIKLKENIVDANSQWNDIKALQVRNYNLKEGQTHKQIGLIAQEVEPISPGLVYESPDRDENGNDLGTVTKSVNYSVLYMKAVKALQEAMERIEQLEQRLADAGI